MDANQLHFWMLATDKQWAITGDPPTLAYHAERHGLRLASRRPPLPTPPVDAAEAERRLARVPQARDPFGGRAFWQPNAEGGGLVLGAGAMPDAVPIFAPPVGAAPTDLLLGHDGVLYLAIEGRIVMQDRRARWPATDLGMADFSALRLAPAVGGGVWALDPQRRALARLHGTPLPTQPLRLGASDASFQLCEPNPDPPQLRLLDSLAWAAGERPVALATSLRGQLALLSWNAAGSGLLRLLDATEQLGSAVKLVDVTLPYSIAWLDEGRIAILTTELPGEALIYTLEPQASQLRPTGDYFPLREHDGGPFCHGLDTPPHYATARGTHPLHPVSTSAYLSEGAATGAAPIDSGNSATVWHRLYLEAAIPARCGVIVWLATSDSLEAPTAADQWHEHRFGARFAPGDGQTPLGAWAPFPSEIPYHPGLLKCAPEPDRAGLFTALIQRPRRRVRNLCGRYLWVRVGLLGDGRSTPELAAVRAYGSRFSYLNNYLPELYREHIFGPDADATVPIGQAGGSTPADFLERFLDNFEGMLTILEDRMARADLLSDPRTVPAESLEWLASWIGVAIDPGYPVEHQRALIAAAPELFRRRGTLAGLSQALDIATGGAVSGGEIVILENFRLRRVVATILGVDLADEADPLTAGIVASGNSSVGDTLVLGDESRAEFLALFRGDLPVTAAERAQIDDLFERLANRVTVLVHQAVEPPDLGLVRRIVEQETPAHVQARVLPVSRSFMVGISSLLGVDSYLGPRPTPRPVRIDESRIGLRDLLISPASLDPRLEGAGAAIALDHARPLAALGDTSTPSGAPVILDGSASSAPPGRTIVRYIWTFLGPAA
jgi:phage tail-like protein